MNTPPPPDRGLVDRLLDWIFGAPPPPGSNPTTTQTGQSAPFGPGTPKGPGAAQTRHASPDPLPPAPARPDA